MANGIKLRRGLQTALETTIADGELVIATDTNKLGFKSGSTEYFVDLSKINTIAGLEEDLEAITALMPKADPDWIRVTFDIDKAKLETFMMANGGLSSLFGIKVATITSTAADYLSDSMSGTYLPIKINSCYYFASYINSYGNPSINSVSREDYTGLQVVDPYGNGINYFLKEDPAADILAFRATDLDSSGSLANIACFSIDMNKDPGELDNLILSFDVSIYNPEIDDGNGNVFRIFTPITPTLVYIEAQTPPSNQ